MIRDCLRAEGPYRPPVIFDSLGRPVQVGESALVRYPRESDLKFARRNEVAWFASPLMQACSKFVGHIAMQAVVRALRNDLYQSMADDIDGRGNAIDVFWQSFMLEAKARGSMLLLVDMPSQLPDSLGTQLAARVAPYWTAITPESVTDFEIGDDGKFNYVEFAGQFVRANGDRVDCVWHFDREGWLAKDKNNRVLASADHPLGECPVIAFTERGDFPAFGQFAPIADLARRLFNLQSEHDEILRSQTFSLLTMQVPDNSTDEMKLAAAKVAGETIGTNNLLVHSGSTPSFIAPDSGPAATYLDTIKLLRQQIADIAMEIDTPTQAESGIALKMRFQSLNAALAQFSNAMQDFEMRAWSLSAKWLGLSQLPTLMWPRDFTLADVDAEIKILSAMQMAGMPDEVIAAQSKRVVQVQFSGLSQEERDTIMRAIDERLVAAAAQAEIAESAPPAADAQQGQLQ